MNKERLIVLAKALGISLPKLSKSLGKSDSYIRTMSGFAGSDLIGEILRVYPQINVYWLLTGDGDIFDKKENILQEPSSEYGEREILDPSMDLQNVVQNLSLAMVKNAEASLKTAEARERESRNVERLIDLIVKKRD